MFIKEYINYLKDNPEGYWFKRKVFGWGWSPATRQGWLTILIFAVVILWMGIGFSNIENPSTSDSIAFVVELGLVLALLIYISHKKGEKPCWKWGFTKEEHQKYCQPFEK